MSPAKLTKNIAKGTLVIPKNKIHDLKKPCGIGKGLATKVNANIGTSEDHSSIDFEL